MDICAGIYRSILRKLFRRHIRWRPENLSGDCDGLSEMLLRSLCHLRYSKIDNLDNGAGRVVKDQDIGWLEIPVNCPLLVSMIDGQTHIRKEFQPLPDIQTPCITVFCERRAPHQLHSKKWAPVCRHACLNQLGNIRVLHHRKHLLFYLETLENSYGVHSQLENLEGNFPHHGLSLPRSPDNREAPFSQLGFEAVGPN